MWSVFKKNNKPSRQKIALCLNSSFFGFYAHSGFLLELNRMGIYPEKISGASAGAIVAGLYAAGLEPDTIIRLFLRKKLNRAFWEPGLPKRLLFMLLNRTGATGLLSGSKMLDLLESEVGDMLIENCPVASLEISVANMTTSKQELKTSGPLARTVLASCSVPGMFSTHKINDHHFWDGGIADPVPFEQWLMDSDIDIIVLHLVITENPNHSNNNFSPGLWSGLGSASQIINDEIIRMKIRLAQLAKKRVIVLKTRTPLSGPTRMYLGPQNIMLGRKTVRLHAEELKTII